MEVAIRPTEDLDDAIEGAVIECLMADEDGGFRIVLTDGRSLLIPEATLIAILPRDHTH